MAEVEELRSFAIKRLQNFELADLLVKYEMVRILNDKEAESFFKSRIMGILGLVSA